MISTESQSQATSKRILQAARRLFSQLGFAGTSIRHIAGESGVNIAAINYHFKTKENLYWSVILDSFAEAESRLKAIALASTSLVEFSMAVFDHFRSESELVRNTMKMMLSEVSANLPEDFDISNFTSSFGPPGGRYFGEFIEKELAFALNPRGHLWGVKSIFGTILHWSTMCTTPQLQIRALANPLYSYEQIRWDVEQMVAAHLNHLKQNPGLFGAQDFKGASSDLGGP